MVRCRVCATVKPDERLEDPMCGCGGKAHAACLAMLAHVRAAKTGCFGGWTRCTVCRQKYKSGRLVEVLFKLWAHSAATPDEKIAFYGAYAKIMKKTNRPNQAARAFKLMVETYRAKGEDMASSLPMLAAMLNFGGSRYDGGHTTHAMQIFEWVATKSASTHAWTGLDNLAFICARAGLYTKAKIALAKALEYTTIDPAGRARIELRYAALCLETYDYCTARTIANNANPHEWGRKASVPSPVHHVLTEAENGIRRFANLLFLEAQ